MAAKASYAQPTRSDQAGGTGKVVVFSGSTPNIGTTLVALGTALQLAQQAEEAVGLICLNLKSSKLHRYIGKERCPPGLDQLRAEMRAGNLTAGKLQSCFEALREQPGVHVLYGSMQREQAEFFQPEDIRHLLDCVRGVYGVCFIDVNAYWDNAATITALLEADERVLVTTPDLGHFQEDVERTIKTLGPLFGIAPDSFLLALNQYNPKETGGITAADVERETGMKLSAAIPWDYSVREWINRGCLPDYALYNKAFRQALWPLCQCLLERLGMKAREAGSSSLASKGWRPWFGGRQHGNHSFR